MSVAEQITALTTDKTNIRDSILAKGGTCPSENGFDDFATDIGTIPSGITPSGNIALTATDTTQTGIDVTNYATASVAPTPRQIRQMVLGADAPTAVTPDAGCALSRVNPLINPTVIKAENIAEGVTILGIEGTHSGGGSSVVIGTGKVQDFQFNNVTADFTSCSNFAMVAYLNNLEAFVPGESGYNAFAVVLENGQYYAIGIYSNGRTVKLATVTIADVQTKRIILNFNTLVGSTVAPLQGGSWMIFGW